MRTRDQRDREAWQALGRFYLMLIPAFVIGFATGTIHSLWWLAYVFPALIVAHRPWRWRS